MYINKPSVTKTGRVNLPYIVLPLKLDWFLSTIDTLWEKIAALTKFS